MYGALLADFSHLTEWFWYFRDKYRFYACMLRARFDENKNEKDMMKATMMLKAGEEEFWTNQHPQPYIFPDSPGGTSYERYECYKVSPCASPGSPPCHYFRLLRQYFNRFAVGVGNMPKIKSQYFGEFWRITIFTVSKKFFLF